VINRKKRSLTASSGKRCSLRFKPDEIRNHLYANVPGVCRISDHMHLTISLFFSESKGNNIQLHAPKHLVFGNPGVV
jgi:hypothetical protein